MSILYKSASGRTVTHASSSALDAFRFCRRKFRLSRVDGWKEKSNKASLQFGKGIEAAIQYYSDNGRKTGEAESEFRRLWAKWLDQPLDFTDQEKNWTDLNTMGTEMMRLFEVVLPTLPIRNPKWQLQYVKKLWPGTDLDDLEFMAYIDLLSTLEDGSRLLIDIKTAKSGLDVTPGMIAMDGQLRKYAWVSGIRNVGFLNFVKAEPNGFKKGSRITLLEDSLDHQAGTELTVWKSSPPDDSHPEFQLVVAPENVIKELDEELELIKGKGSTEAKAAKTAEYYREGGLHIVDREQVTKTRIQLVLGEIPEEEFPEIGQQIGNDMLQIRESTKNNFFPQDGGVRFPNASCSWCNFRGICLKDDRLRDELLVHIKPAEAEKETDWLSELEEETE